MTVTYDGSAIAPTRAGTYAVVATINDPNYAGSATGTLIIAKATATISLTGLTQTYTGSPLAVTAVTTPASLAVSITYDGLAIAPTGAGTYAVVATINDPNYAGSATGTLVVAKESASITLTGLAQTYTGSPLSVTATTTPASLAVTYTYDVSPTSPTGAGTYAVVATIDDANYAGTAAGTLVIAKAHQSIAFSPLASPITYTAPIPLIATGGGSDNPVVFSVLSGPGSVTGDFLTITGPGALAVARIKAATPTIRLRPRGPRRSSRSRLRASPTSRP